MSPVLTRIALILSLNTGLFAVTQQFTIQFSASSGNIPLNASGTQMAQLPLTIQFPAGFPVSQQTCLFNLGIDSPCKRISSSATATFNPMPVPPNSPNASDFLSGTILLSNTLGGQFNYSDALVCDDQGNCQDNPLSRSPATQTKSFTFLDSPTFVTFTFLQRITTINGRTNAPFGSASLQGELVVEVNVAGPITPPALSVVPKTNGAIQRCSSFGNPCDAATGNKFETVSDYESAGTNKLSFTRYYNSGVNRYRSERCGYELRL